jgi:hypothetical protein
MPIAMKCPGCPVKHQFEDTLAGQRVRCKECMEVFFVRGPRPESGGDRELAGSATTSALSAAAARRRKRLEEEITERSYERGPSTASVVGALAAAALFLVALAILVVVLVTRPQ